MQLLDKTTLRYLGHRGIPGGQREIFRFVVIIACLATLLAIIIVILWADRGWIQAT